MRITLKLRDEASTRNSRRPAGAVATICRSGTRGQRPELQLYAVLRWKRDPPGVFNESVGHQGAPDTGPRAARCSTSPFSRVLASF
jgi:hypothetical protein